jgi:hypothetical protein
MSRAGIVHGDINSAAIMYYKVPAVADRVFGFVGECDLLVMSK